MEMTIVTLKGTVRDFLQYPTVCCELSLVYCSIDFLQYPTVCCELSLVYCSIDFLQYPSVCCELSLVYCSIDFLQYLSVCCELSLVYCSVDFLQYPSVCCELSLVYCSIDFLHYPSVCYKLSPVYCSIDFLQYPSVCCELSPVYFAQVSRAHTQHMGRLSHATSCVTCYEGTARLLSLTKLKSHFILALFHWLNTLTSEGWEETGVPRENPQCHASVPHTKILTIQAPTMTRTHTLALVTGPLLGVHTFSPWHHI